MKRLAWRLLFERAEHWIVRLIRSGLASVPAAVGDYSLLVFLVEVFGVPAVRASIFSFIFGMSINYLFMTFWVFPGDEHGRRDLQFVFFAITAGTGLLVHTGVMYLLIVYVELFYVLAKALSLFAAFLWNFLWRWVTHNQLKRIPRQ
ncbi:MAG: GtrA family protein [Spirochaetaceae bacterium]